MAGSLGAALLLTKDTRGGGKKTWAVLITTAVLTASVLMLWASGAKGTAMTMLFAGVFGLFLIGGTFGGVTVYRTLFFIPSFTSGVAVYLLWKKMYSDIGPINTSLAAPLDSLGQTICKVEPNYFRLGLAGLLTLAMAWLAVSSLLKFLRRWRDGDLGTCALIFPIAFIATPCLVYALLPASRFTVEDWTGFSALVGQSLHYIPFAALIVAAIIDGIRSFRNGQDFPATTWKGMGDALMLALLTLTGLFVLLGLSLVAYNLPAMAQSGLTPPKWLADYNWAKPAIMIMGLWGSIGSNNMLLYIAGLTNIPPELYEAADIDGASPRQRFWNVTWPQLAPITFFIFIMSVIGGLQGGFEMARTMTQGGPAGSTTPLAYFIYTQGFETGRFGSASGVAWALFALVLSVTLINWKFGSRYVND